MRRSLSSSPFLLPTDAGTSTDPRQFASGRFRPLHLDPRPEYPLEQPIPMDRDRSCIKAHQGRAHAAFGISFAILPIRPALPSTCRRVDPALRGAARDVSRGKLPARLGARRSPLLGLVAAP